MDFDKLLDNSERFYNNNDYVISNLSELHNQLIPRVNFKEYSLSFSIFKKKGYRGIHTEGISFIREYLYSSPYKFINHEYGISSNYNTNNPTWKVLESDFFQDLLYRNDIETKNEKYTKKFLKYSLDYNIIPYFNITYEQYLIMYNSHMNIYNKVKEIIDLKKYVLFSIYRN